MPLSFLTAWSAKRLARKIGRYTFAVPEIGLTIQAPLDFDLVPAGEIEDEKKKYGKAMKRLGKKDLSDPHTRTVFSARKPLFNTMSCSVTPIPERSDFEKYTADRACKELVLELIKVRMPHAMVDNRIATANIAGKEFEDFQLVIQVGEKILFKGHMYSAEINAYKIEITSLYQNSQIGEYIMSSLKSSKFE